MPEGPSIVLLKEEAEQFTGMKIMGVSGNSQIDQKRVLNKKIIKFNSWGKHFLICFKDFSLRIHFLMFGTYCINGKKDKPVRLNLTFNKGEINFYTCSIKYLEGDINTHYDFSSDVMNDEWDIKKARVKLKAIRGKLICDALLEQDIFSGVGNIIKNEILYRVRIHPNSIIGKIPAPKIKNSLRKHGFTAFNF